MKKVIFPLEMPNLTPLSIGALVAIAYFVIWFASMCLNGKKQNSCPSGSKWDDAPLFPVCQKVCPEGEISDGRGACVSALIPGTKLTLDKLGKGHLK